VVLLFFIQVRLLQNPSAGIQKIAALSDDVFCGWRFRRVLQEPQVIPISLGSLPGRFSVRWYGVFRTQRRRGDLRDPQREDVPALNGAGDFIASLRDPLPRSAPLRFDNPKSGDGMSRKGAKAQRRSRCQQAVILPPGECEPMRISLRLCAFARHPLLPSQDLG